MQIPFNRPSVTGAEKKHLDTLLEAKNLPFSGNQVYTKRCVEWLCREMQIKKALLVPSCTAALEMAALLLDFEPGDEVIMPSYTFVSTANAFVLRGAVPVFVDIDPWTLNMDPACIEKALTPRTKAICCVHYAGVACQMESILTLAKQYGLFVIEDAAQGMCAYYRGKALGTWGDLGCYSFHETKNYHCGEGGALLINNEALAARAEILQEKGTNRSQFYRGEVDKYSWVDIGSSYLMSELQAAFLLGQLESAQEILADRLASWDTYYEGLESLAQEGWIQLPFIPKECSHNGHLFYLLTKDEETRTELLAHLKAQGIMAIFHYLPLHSSLKGSSVGRFVGEDRYTSRVSQTIVRLPLFFRLSQEEKAYIIDQVMRFFAHRSTNAT